MQQILHYLFIDAHMGCKPHIKQQQRQEHKQKKRSRKLRIIIYMCIGRQTLSKHLSSSMGYTTLLHLEQLLFILMALGYFQTLHKFTKNINESKINRNRFCDSAFNFSYFFLSTEKLHKHTRAHRIHFSI